MHTGLQHNILCVSVFSFSEISVQISVDSHNRCTCIWMWIGSITEGELTLDPLIIYPLTPYLIGSITPGGWQSGYSMPLYTNETGIPVLVDSGCGAAVSATSGAGGAGGAGDTAAGARRLITTAKQGVSDATADSADVKAQYALEAGWYFLSLE
jgi:hypothetical protein